MDLTPKDFELLLCEFCKQDLPKTFTVEHDIKELGLESGNKRQIDTRIKGKLGILDILICGEAKFWNEPVGSETIDGLVGKYLSSEIRANKVIVFSNQGYTEPAITRAKHLGIELLEPKELNNPIRSIPHIVGLGSLSQIIFTLVGPGPQYIQMSLNPDDYIILKGNETLSFQRYAMRLVRDKLRAMKDKDIYTDLSKISVLDKNVLYELKDKPGFRYCVDIDLTITLHWEYYSEDLPAGILHHLNSAEVKFVVMESNPNKVVDSILLSETKINYQSKADCIEKVIKNNKGCSYRLCLLDPDQQKIDPTRPLLIPI